MANPIFECQCGTNVTNFHETSPNVYMGMCPSCKRWWRFERIGYFWKYRQIPSAPITYKDYRIDNIPLPPNLYMGSDGIMRPLLDAWRETVDALDFGDEGE